MTQRESLIGWANFCYGQASAQRNYGNEWSRASDMLECVDESTRTAADCLRFYLTFRIDNCPTMKQRWHRVRREAAADEQSPYYNTELRKLVDPFRFSYAFIESIHLWSPELPKSQPLPLP